MALRTPHQRTQLVRCRPARGQPAERELTSMVKTPLESEVGMRNILIAYYKRSETMPGGSCRYQQSGDSASRCKVVK